MGAVPVNVPFCQSNKTAALALETQSKQAARPVLVKMIQLIFRSLTAAVKADGVLEMAFGCLAAIDVGYGMKTSLLFR